MIYTPVPVFDCEYCVRGKEFEVLDQKKAKNIQKLSKNIQNYHYLQILEMK